MEILKKNGGLLIAYLTILVVALVIVGDVKYSENKIEENNKIVMQNK